MEKEKRTEANPRKRKVIALNMDAAFFFERAVQSLDRFHYDKALKYFRRAVELEPDNPVNYFNMAGILSEIGNFEESNLILRQILDRLDPGMTECYFYMANNYANMERFEEAEQALVQYLEEDAAGLYLEECEEMIEYLSFELERPTKIRNIKSREHLFEHDRARMLLEEGKFFEATRILEKLVRKTPSFTAARNNLALAYYYTGHTEKCLAMIRQVLEFDSGNLHALCNLAIVYKHHGEEAELIPLRDMLSRMYPLEYDHLFKLATTMGILGEHTHALRYFTRLLKMADIGDPCIYHYTAVAAANSGRYDLARKYWKLAERSDPDSAVAGFYMSQLDDVQSGNVAGTISYHYHLPFEGEAFRAAGRIEEEAQHALHNDPLLRSSFLWALKNGNSDTKLQVIKAMGASRDRGMESALREFLMEKSEDDYLKRVAIFVLRGMGVSGPLKTVIGGRHMEVKHTVTTELPIWLDTWQRVMDTALLHMRKRYDVVQQHDLQTLWVEYLSRTYPSIPRIVKPEAWAAALEYLTAKMHRRTISFRDVSDRYEVSVSTIRKNVDRIDQMCGIREKMKAIFPQFQGKI